MKKITLTSVLCGAGLLALANCATVGPEHAGITFRKGGYSGASGAVGDKRGEACAHNILGLVSIGDASVETAARAGGITKPGAINYEDMAFWVYARKCVIVQGG